MDQRRRTTVSQYLRLGVVAVPVLLGVGTAVGLFVAMAVVLGFIAIAAINIVAVVVGYGTLSLETLTYLLYACTGIGVVAWGYFMLRRFRQRVAQPSAALVAETRPPETAAERESEATLTRLCRRTDVPKPVLRIHETDTPECLTVSYRDDDPPGDHREPPERGADAETSATSDYVVVVSTAVYRHLDERQITALLAHEVTQLDSWDRRMTQALAAVLETHPLSDLGRIEAVIYLGIPYGVLYATLGSALVVVARGQAFASDDAGARLTGDPEALASALAAIDDLGAYPPTDHRIVHLLNGFPIRGGQLRYRYVHPSTRKRIERLQTTETA